MLREAIPHTDWCEMTMSMLREKQFEACEKRLSAHMGHSLFAPEATQLDAQALLSGSFEASSTTDELITLEELRSRVLARLSLEAVYVSTNEAQLLERLLQNDGLLLLDEYDDIGAAEALVRRLWCGVSTQDDNWLLTLPEALHAPILEAMNQKESKATRGRMFHFDATIHGLLYIAGLLPCIQPLDIFMREVMHRTDSLALQVAKRYIQSTYEYMTDATGGLILLHPGLADPYRLFQQQTTELITLELSEELLVGGMNGLLPEEIPLHETMCGALNGALRPEYDLEEAAEDLRILAKQGVSLHEMESVMASMLAMLPNKRMKEALQQLYLCTPHWMGLRTSLMH